MRKPMIRVSDFYVDSASEQWFTTPSRKSGSVHEQLKARNFTLIDRPTLKADYQDLNAPVEMVDLSYAVSIPAPTLGFKTTFMPGYAYEFRRRKFKDRMLSDVLTVWMNSTLSNEKYLMSLFPKSYLLAKANSIDFDNIFEITRLWSVDAFIGVFDKTGKAMFVFAQEYGVVHVSFEPSNVPAEFDEVSDQVDKAGFLKDMQGRTGGDPDRIKEYYNTVVKPVIQ